MGKRLTYEQVKNFIEIESNSGCKLASKEYKNYKSSLDILCNCGKTFPTSFGDFKYNHKRQCNDCGKQILILKTRMIQNSIYNCNNPELEIYLKIKNFIEIESNSGCILLTKFDENINNKTILSIKCNCGEIFKTKFGKFKLRNKRQCNKCGQVILNNKIKKPYEDFIKDFYDVCDKNEFVLKSEFINPREKINMYHNICQNEFEVYYQAFLRKPECRICSGECNKQSFDYLLQVNCNNFFERKGEYITSNIPIEILHKKCGSIWKCSPINILYNYTDKDICPVCSPPSFGEEKINGILINNQINFLPQYKFKECRNKQSLPFDFAIFKNNKLILLIEYQGEQHYKPVVFFGGEEKFKLQQKRDKIKKDFCINEKINLTIIPYWEFDNIEEILLLEISKYNLSIKEAT